MKIALLHFWTLRLPRGVETLTQSLGNALAEQGHTVTLICAQGTRKPPVEPSPRVRVKAFPTFRYHEATTIIPFYAQELVRGQYDVIVAFFADFGEGRALQLAKRYVHSRLMLYLTFPYESAPHRYAAYKRFGWDKRADVVLADAAYTAERGAEFLGRPVVVLPSGTDPERFRPDPSKRAAVRARFGFGERDTVLLNVSALERRKGTWRVVEALPAVLEQSPNMRYLIMGEGTERETLERRVGELGIGAAVRFAGTTSDLTGIYNAADIFVMLSDEEAGSIALLEAMASGLPVVVSANGGFGEVVDTESGMLVERDDCAAVSHAIVTLARDADLRTGMGAHGRARILAEYSWGRLAQKFEELCNPTV